MSNSNTGKCYHYELWRLDLPGFCDKAYSKATLLRRAKKFWSNCTIHITKIESFRDFNGKLLEYPVSTYVISI